jgi:hypothetical protein
MVFFVHSSRHNGVHLFISHLGRWLSTRRFSEPTFRPSGATNHWKNTAFRDFPSFSRTWIFFLLKLSLLFIETKRWVGLLGDSHNKVLSHQHHITTYFFN